MAYAVRRAIAANPAAASLHDAARALGSELIGNLQWTNSPIDINKVVRESSRDAYDCEI